MLLDIIFSGSPREHSICTGPRSVIWYCNAEFPASSTALPGVEMQVKCGVRLPASA